MEAAAAGAGLPQQQQLLRQGLQQLDSGVNLAPGIPGLDVVRALHQTVISLRTALDRSREELNQLKERKQRSETEPPPTSVRSHETVEWLALENHLLRRRLLGRAGEFTSDAATNASPPTRTPTSPPPRTLELELLEEGWLSEKVAKMEAESGETSNAKASGQESTKEATDEEKSATASAPVPDNLEVLARESVSEGSLVGEGKDESEPRSSHDAKLTDQRTFNESENESEELDDIELIFTTDDTCRDVCLQEGLVSITDTDNWQQSPLTPTSSDQHKSLLKSGQSKSGESEAELACNDSTSTSNEKPGSVEEAASSQSSSIDREESVDRFDESSGSRLNKLWSQCSVLVETDISKCGVLEEADLVARHAARRNTLAAPTAAYRPIIHREALAAGRRKSSAPLRPVMDRSGSGEGARRESGAQTDISALPGQWRSESYLAHKVAHAFTTLPSKFALPAGVPGRMRLSYKTREAKRVMLSDISFTSMVPELSRSADHLCQESQNQFPQPHYYTSRGGCGLRTPESNRRESWNRSGATSIAGLPSPCDCRLSTDLYSARYRGSLSSIATPISDLGGPTRRHSWRPNVAASFDGWRGPAVGPGGGPNASSAGQPTRPTWSSMPSSPTHVQPPTAALIARLVGGPSRRARSKVTFQECPMIRGSLPNLRSETLEDNSGDSTESLIDEAEDYLRRSIDSMLTISTSGDPGARRHLARRRRARRHSEPDLFRDWNPPRDARPYLPKIPRDLKLDHLVKVISPEGKILQGRVRYVGPITGKEDVHVGVELPNENGISDGTIHGRRYFDCEPEHAIFVPFKKVVLAWCTT
ncbi:PREDICTED: uncharacterized protein LOC105369053 [Ceratosolen solmsi marchali]|uniref:Uncharacterized protein LOC105369053 n=1 Tax=Ceratosolen solmsi marchali TaxID=326594 RepID=A0AAJ6YYD8_9HYME|nr:PREDICTED: uncharacterized protein LOC105369053 [Ceratosolen solmsi marchali]